MIENEIPIKQLEKYLEHCDTENMSEKELQQLIDQFIKEYNRKRELKNKGMLKLSDEEQAYQLYDQAMDCEDPAKVKRLLKKALKLYPDFLDAKIALTMLIEDPIKCIKELERLEKIEKKKLEDENYFKDDNISYFYGIIETRPYIRLLYAIANEYYKMGCLKKAISLFENIIYLNKSDNLGCRHSLMAIFAQLEDEEKMNQILENYPENSVPVHLFQTILYYHLTDFTKAKKSLRSLYHIVPEFKQFLNGDMDEDDFYESLPGDYYQAYSLQEILFLLSQHKHLFSNENLLFWMQNEINKMK